MTKNYSNVEYLALGTIAYSLIALVFRISVHESFTPDEITQLLGGLLLALGIFFSDQSSSFEYAFGKMFVLLLVALWTRQVQISGPSRRRLVERNVMDLENKVVLVTGGNSGIGLETARFFFNRGAIVVVASRNVQLAEQVFARETATAPHRLIVLRLDMEDFKQVREFASEFCAKFPMLDIFIQNAGSLMLERKVTGDGWESMMQTNCYSALLLVLLLLKPLRRSKANRARIVLVSSSSCKLFHALPGDLNSTEFFNCFYTYAKSKYCVNQLYLELERRMAGEISLNLVHPGTISTSIVRNMHIVIQYARHLLFVLYKTLRQGSNTQIYVASNLAVDGVSGKYFENCCAHPVHKLAREDAIEFFTRAEQVVGERFNRCWEI